MRSRALHTRQRARRTHKRRTFPGIQNHRATQRSVSFSFRLPQRAQAQLSRIASVAEPSIPLPSPRTVTYEVECTSGSACTMHVHLATATRSAKTSRVAVLHVLRHGRCEQPPDKAHCHAIASSDQPQQHPRGERQEAGCRSREQAVSMSPAHRALSKPRRENLACTDSSPGRDGEKLLPGALNGAGRDVAGSGALSRLVQARRRDHRSAMGLNSGQPISMSRPLLRAWRGRPAHTVG